MESVAEFLLWNDYRTHKCGIVLNKPWASDRRKRQFPNIAGTYSDGRRCPENVRRNNHRDRTGILRYISRETRDDRYDRIQTTTDRTEGIPSNESTALQT